MSSTVPAPATEINAAHPRHKIVTAFWLVMFLIFNTLASVCFKEGGTDRAHKLQYFIIGNTFGPLSVIFLMILYKRMHANLALALAVGLATVVVQIAFLFLYKQYLQWWQWGGIAILTVGVAMVMMGGKQKPAEPESDEPPA